MPTKDYQETDNEEAEKLYYQGFQYDNKNQYDKALEYYIKAAEMNYIQAQYRIGYCYKETGNIKEAIKWYTKAAMNGYGSALFSLGSLNEYGNGVYKNRITALNWYKKAVKHGVGHAQWHIDKLTN